MNINLFEEFSSEFKERMFNVLCSQLGGLGAICVNDNGWITSDGVITNNLWEQIREKRNILRLLRNNASLSAPFNFLKSGLSVLLPKKCVKEAPTSLANHIWIYFKMWWKKVA